MTHGDGEGWKDDVERAKRGIVRRDSLRLLPAMKQMVNRPKFPNYYNAS